MPCLGDQDIAAKIKQAALCLDILVMDDLFITTEHYLSFADEGLL